MSSQLIALSRKFSFARCFSCIIPRIPSSNIETRFAQIPYPFPNSFAPFSFLNPSARSFLYVKANNQAFSPYTQLTPSILKLGNPPPFGHPREPVPLPFNPCKSPLPSTFKSPVLSTLKTPPYSLKPYCLLLSKTFVSTSYTQLTPSILKHGNPPPFTQPPYPLLLSSSSFSTMAETKLTPIKLVATFDLKQISAEEYEKNMIKLERRFPLVYRKGGGLMRRTVGAVDTHFKMNRNFLGVKIVCEGQNDLQIVICTRTTQMVGVKGEGKLVLLGPFAHLRTKEFAVIAEVLLEQIQHHPLVVPDDPKHLLLLRDHFEDAVRGVNSFLVNPLPGKMNYYADCLSLLYAFTFGGVVFPTTRLHVMDGLLAGCIGGAITPTEVRQLKKDWLDISTHWYNGGTTWNEFLISNEVGVVNCSETVEEDQEETGDHVDTRPLTVFEGFVKDLPRYRRDYAWAAWEAAKLGYDEEEFFAETKFEDNQCEEVAREAWKKALDYYY